MKIRSKLSILGLFSFLALITMGQAIYAVEVIGELTRIISIVPGGEHEGKIVIKNNSDLPEDIRITQSDYMFSAEGGGVFGKPGSESRSNALWIAVTPDHVTLSSQEKTSIAFRIKVPSKNTLKGTYWSLINVDPIPEGTLEPFRKETTDQLRIGLQTVIGYGVQIITNVGDISGGSLQFSNPELILKDPDYIFMLNVGCTGDSMLIPDTWMDLYDSKGGHVKKVTGGAFFVYPGCSRTLKLPLGKLEKGLYKALLIADCGNDQVFGGQYELEIR